VAYADWVKKHHQFSDMLVQTSPAVTGHAFPRLKLRYKPSLVQVCYPCFFVAHEIQGSVASDWLY
jgi:predicted sulfurtransferase